MPNRSSSTFTPLRLISIGIIILLVSVFWWWYQMMYLSPSRVFERMLANMLSTPSVIKSVHQKESGQEIIQRTRLQASPQQRVQSIVALREGPNGATVVTTESIGTIAADFVRYIDIKTDQKNAEGKNFDFASVIGIWGRSDANNPISGGAQLYNQTVLGVLPIGNLTPNQRQDLLKQIKNDQVYTIDYVNVRKTSQNGRLVYGYDATVKPVAYVAMLKTYARDIGLTQLEAVDPNEYANSAPLRFSFEIDALSGQLKKIIYNDSDRTEMFAGYGVRQQIELPDQAVPVEDIQSRLQQIQ